MDQLGIVELASQRVAWLSRVVLIATLVLVLGAAIGVALSLYNGTNDKELAYAISTLFVIVSVPLSSQDIRDHLHNFEVPELQKFIVRILMMVPIYSVTCWICLANEDYYVFFEAMRSLYEAFVIWNFTYFLMGYLGPTEEMLAAHLECKPQEHHIFPVSLVLGTWKMGHEFLFKCKLGTLQYVIWKIVNVGIVLLTTVLGVYGDGQWRLDRAYFYVVSVTNFSQMLAIYSLALFYHATYHDLAPIKPLAKFLCIKLVIFFSFWQGCLISALVYFGYIHSTPFFSANTYAKGLQDFIICFEMMLFAVAHHYVFSYRDFRRYIGESDGFNTIDSTTSSQGSGSRPPMVQALLEAANPRDLVHDIARNFHRINSRSSFSSAFDSDDEHRAAESAAALSEEAVALSSGNQLESYGVYESARFEDETFTSARGRRDSGRSREPPRDVL